MKPKDAKARYIAIQVPHQGWRIWHTTVRAWWGAPSPEYPAALLEELNGLKRTDHIQKLLHS